MIHLNAHGLVDPHVFHDATDDERAALELTRTKQVQQAADQHLRTFDPDTWVEVIKARREEAMARKRDYAGERAYKFEEVRHLMSFGEHPDRIARRLHTTTNALENLARRWGEPEIATYMCGRGEAA